MGELTDLDLIYAQVPPMRCVGLCWDSCGSIGITEPETLQILWRRGVVIESGAFDGHCPALSVFGRCTIYEDRPLICRVWGAVPAMRCSYGCEPTLTDEQGEQLLQKLFALERRAV